MTRRPLADDPHPTNLRAYRDARAERCAHCDRRIEPNDWRVTSIGDRVRDYHVTCDPSNARDRARDLASIGFNR